MQAILFTIWCKKKIICTYFRPKLKHYRVSKHFFVSKFENVSFFIYLCGIIYLKLVYFRTQLPDINTINMKRIYITTLWLTLMLCLCTSILSAKTQSLYTTIDGLPSSRLQNITFDAKDFLWISSDMGLTRFDGEEFVTYQAKKDSPNHLQVNYVNSLFTDRYGTHWVGAGDGLYYLCRSSNKFTRYPLSSHRNDISVSCILDYPLQEHKLLVGSYGFSIHVFDTEQRCFDEELSQKLSSLLHSDFAPFLHVDQYNRLWALEGKWLTVIDLKQMKTLELKTDLTETQQKNLKLKGMAEDDKHNLLYLSDPERGLYVADLKQLTLTRKPLPFSYINTLAMSPQGLLIIATEGQGLWSLNPETDELNRIVASGDVNLNSAKVQHIAFDLRDNMWLGIYQNGIMKIAGPQQIFGWQSVAWNIDDPRNLACVAGFATLSNGDRAYALDGAGVMIMHRDNSRTLYDMASNKLPSNACLSLFALNDGTLLVGLYRHGIYRIWPDGKTTRMSGMEALDRLSVYDMKLDTKRQQIYIATNGKGIYAYSLKERQLCPISTVEDEVEWTSTIYVTTDDHLWAGTANRPRYKDLSTGEWHTPEMPNTLTSITGFAEDEEHNLWMSSSYGLLRFDRQNNTLIQVTEEDNDKQPSYSSIICNAGNQLWLVSSDKVTMFDLKSRRHIRYQDVAITTLGTPSPRSAIQWPDGSISFGGDNGVLNFLPSNVLQSKLQLPPINLKRLWVDNKLTDFDPDLQDRGETNVLDSALWCATKLTLPAGHASFSLSYALIDYASTPGLHYSHRLKGFEKNWHESNAMTASYPSLPAGKYTLEIRACQQGNEEDEAYVTRTLEVEVLNFWWATWWAKLLWITLFTGISYYIYSQIRLRKHAHRALREARRMQERKEEKFDLLISVSHEIKTPLTLIISPLRKLLRRKTDPATHSVIEAIYRNSLRILMLVNEQLDVRKLDQGQLHLHANEFVLRSFLDDMMQFFRNVAVSRHLTYTLQMPDNRDEMTIWADPHQLDKVMLNLLSNAIKYVADNGTVEVSVKDCEMPDGQPGIRTTIYNSGSQLPEEQQAEAFESIGLKLSSELVKLHHGVLNVRNLAEGVAFDVDLPAGNKHYTTAELAVIEPIVAVNYDELPDEVNESEQQHEEYAQATTLKEEMDDRELVEQLNDELRETQRMRERRSSLSFDYQRMQMSSGDEKLLHRVVDVIHKNMSDPEFSVESLSQEVGISRVHLNRKLKELIDTSPSSLIKSVRLKQAAFLLAQSNVTVAEVAYTVGFSSPAYFSSNFSQYFGMTPKEFTNTYTENPDSEELKQLLQ